MNLSSVQRKPIVLLIGNSVMLNSNESHGFKAGLDFFANTKSTFGVMVNGNLAKPGLTIIAGQI